MTERCITWKKNGWRCKEPAVPGANRCAKHLAVIRSESRRKSKGIRRCSLCGERGHYAKTCTQEVPK